MPDKCFPKWFWPLLVVLIAAGIFAFIIRTNQEGISPTPSATSSPLATAEQNIVVYSPQPQERVGLPLKIEGMARVFENLLNYRLLDANWEILAEGFTTALAPDIGQFGSFGVEVNYPEPKGADGLLEVFSLSPKDAAEINMVRIAVQFSSEVKSRTVLVYFGKKKLQNVNKLLQ